MTNTRELGWQRSCERAEDQRDAAIDERDRLRAVNAELLAVLERFYLATYGRTDLIPLLDFEQARAALLKAKG